MKRAPISIDDAGLDFSAPTQQHQQQAAAAAAAAAPATAPPLPVGEDPALRGVVERQRHAPRRRVVAGFAAFVPDATATVAAPPPPATAAAATQETAMRALIDGPLSPAESLRAYTAALRAFVATQSAAASDAQLLSSVPDVEPWDLPLLRLPRYPAATAAASSNVKPDAITELLHHPVLPDGDAAALAEISGGGAAAAATGGLRLIKTKEELRAERRANMQRKQAEQQAAAAAARARAAYNGDPTDTQHQQQQTEHHDRLSYRTLRTAAGFAASALDPFGVQARIDAEVNARTEQHERANYERHVAALPRQIAKRERDQWRRAAASPPVFAAYRVYPAAAPAVVPQLAAVLKFANDGHLRGFVLHVAKCDALVVLCGGDDALRHVDRWIVEKMRWTGGVVVDGDDEGGGDSSETRAVRVAWCPVKHHEAFSFHLPKHPAPPPPPDPSALTLATAASAAATTGGEDEGDGAAANGDVVAVYAERAERVFLHEEETVEGGWRYLAEQQPACGPWPSLAHIWRAAFAFPIVE